MCGRFTLKTPVDDLLASLFQDPDFRPLVNRSLNYGFIPRFNIAPTQNVLLVRNGTDRTLELDAMRWGLVPAWSESLQSTYSMFNARSETLFEKKAFKGLLNSHRCAVLADGYYEWQSNDSKTKIPHWIHRSSEVAFAMAGLWTVNRRIESDQPLYSCTIITVPSNEDTKSVHDRMPAILLNGNQIREWLEAPIQNESELTQIIHPSKTGTFQLRRVGNSVGNSKNEGSALIDKYETMSLDLKFD